MTTEILNPHENAFDIACLIPGDRDYIPLVRAIKGSFSVLVGEASQMTSSVQRPLLMTCLQCAYEFDASTVGLDSCPKCGSNARALESKDESAIRVSDYAAIQGIQDGRLVGFRESADEQGRRSDADSDDTGHISYSSFGPPSENEQDTLRVIRILTEAWNGRSDSWQSPEALEPSEPADHVLKWQGDPTRTCPIQVVRVVIDQHVYQRLSVAHHFQENRGADSIAETMHRAVIKKADQLTASGCRGLILALDATRFPGFCFPAVLESFASRYSASRYCRSFKEVWLVGPNSDMSHLIARSV
jgi:hypothetical protein